MGVYITVTPVTPCSGERSFLYSGGPVDWLSVARMNVSIRLQRTSTLSAERELQTVRESQDSRPDFSRSLC